VSEKYFFEIVDRPYHRFGWQFVRLRKRDRCVLARGERDYRSRDKAITAALRLAEVVGGARVSEQRRLPKTKFTFVRDTIPLLVGIPGTNRERRHESSLSSAPPAATTEKAEKAEKEAQPEQAEQEAAERESATAGADEPPPSRESGA
jgi:hypothetical protein